MDLLPEFLHVYTPFVIDIDIRIERDSESGVTYARTHVYIFTEHLPEATDLFIDLAGEAHIEGARSEFLHRDFAAAYTAGGKE